MANLKFEPCPSAGTGVHSWLMSQANRCRHAGSSPQATARILRDGTRNCGRHVPESEIRDAVEKAFESTWRAGNRTSRSSPQIVKPTTAWPKPDPKLIQQITESGYGLADLREYSPIRFDDEENHAEEIVDALFPGDPLISVAKAKAQNAITAPRSTFRGRLSSFALMVPSPMAGLIGKNLKGKDSKRCLDNTGPRRFLVVEFDNGVLDNQAARLLHLRKKAPLTLAVYSGGKSVHGWFFCAGISETGLRHFMDYCVMLGADHSTWCRCQMVRIPDGLRDNGQRQTVHYFNPATVKE